MDEIWSARYGSRCNVLRSCSQCKDAFARSGWKDGLPLDGIHGLAQSISRDSVGWLGLMALIAAFVNEHASARTLRDTHLPEYADEALAMYVRLGNAALTMAINGHRSATRIYLCMIKRYGYVGRSVYHDCPVDHNQRLMYHHHGYRLGPCAFCPVMRMGAGASESN